MPYRSTPDDPDQVSRDPLPKAQGLQLRREHLGAAVLIGVALLMAGFIFGRVTADSGTEAPGTTPGATAGSTAPPVTYPLGDEDRSGYWGYAQILPVIVDDFDRDDADSLGATAAGQEWNESAPVWSVSDGRAVAATGGDDAVAVIGNTDAQRFTEVTLMVVEPGVGLVIAYRNPSTYWTMTAQPERNGWVISRVADGEAQEVTFVEGPTDDETSIGVARRAQEIQILIDGGEVGRLTDASLQRFGASGLFSSASSTGAAQWDRFFVGDLPG